MSLKDANISNPKARKRVAIVMAGGQAPMFNFATATDLLAKFAEFDTAGKVAAALCHRVAILEFAKLPTGEYLAKGKTVTAFANVEEDFADNAVWSYGLLGRHKHVMPWRIENEMKAIGANYVQAGLWRSFCRARRQPRHRTTELFGDRNGTTDHRSARSLMARSIMATFAPEFAAARQGAAGIDQGRIQ